MEAELARGDEAVAAVIRTDLFNAFVHVVVVVVIILVPSSLCKKRKVSPHKYPIGSFITKKIEGKEVSWGNFLHRYTYAIIRTYSPLYGWFEKSALRSAENAEILSMTRNI